MLERRAAQTPIAAPARPPKKEKKPNPRNTRDLEKQLARLERDISKQEESIADLDAQIEAAATDYEALVRLTGEKDASQTQLDEMMTQWEALSLQLEQSGG